MTAKAKFWQPVLGALGVIITLFVWQAASANMGPVAPLPSATAVIAKTLELLLTAGLWESTAVTVLMAVVGLAIAIVIGVIVGIAIGTSPVAMHATRVPLEFLKPIPPIVILPVVVLVLGPSVEMGIFLAFFGCFVSIVVQSAAGVFDTDPVARATARSYGMGRVETLARIMLPSALPYIATAVKVCAPTALIVAVVAGLLGGGPGLGQSLLLAQMSGNREALFAYVIILGLLGLVFQGVSQWGERSLLHWHPQHRKEER